MNMKLVVAALALTILATPAFAGGDLPDGKYQCVMDDTLPNGEMVIAGDTYQGPNYDGQYEGSYPFAVDDSDNIAWNGPLGIYSDGFDLIGSSIVTDSNNQPAIEIHLRESGSDVIHTVFCNIE